MATKPPPATAIITNSLEREGVLDMRAHSSRPRKHAGWAAVLAFAGALTAVTVLPAHAADGYSCGSGSYKSGLGRLGAFDCDGTGSTNVTVFVSDVVISGTGTE